MRYRDRKGNEYNGENGQDRLLAFVYGHAVTRLLIRPLLSPIRVPHRRGIFEYQDIEAGDSSICEK